MTSNKSLRALLIGRIPGLLQPVPNLLSRAGFTVDVISLTPLVQRHATMNSLCLVSGDALLLRHLEEQHLEQYNLVILGDDRTIELIAHSDLPAPKKLKLLPVISEHFYYHLYSKIGLSLILEKAKVLTPPYAVVQELHELTPAADRLGYPVMLKLDASTGGKGVFVCQSSEELLAYVTQWLAQPSFQFPLLVQKIIEGTSLDLSAFYQDGQLIHFCHAVEEKTTYPLGPSNLRSYTQLGNLDSKIFSELSALGKALGANGFTNITAIDCAQDQRRYFIEADMRPNAWVDYAKYIGNDIAPAIRAYFERGQTLQFPQAQNPQYPQTILIPHVSRIAFWEILINRYGVWQFATLAQLLRRVIGHPMSMVSAFAHKHIQPHLPQSTWEYSQRILKTLKLRILRAFFN